MAMELNKTNREVMTRDFATVTADASLREAYDAIRKNLEGPPHSPGLIVLDKENKYAGVLTVDDFMRELSRLYRDACDKPGKKDWVERFFNECELAGIKQVSHLMSGKRQTIGAGDSFEKSCEFTDSGRRGCTTSRDNNQKEGTNRAGSQNAQIEIRGGLVSAPRFSLSIPAYRLFGATDFNVASDTGTPSGGGPSLGELWRFP
jgi:hypothetical protein